jgi:Skp family chaperone for outer membrane proteins
VKTSIFSTVCAAGLLACAALAVHAQQPAGPPSSNQLRSGQPGGGSGFAAGGGGGQPGQGGFGGGAGAGVAGGQPQGPPTGGGAPRQNSGAPVRGAVVAVIDLNNVMNNYVTAKKQVEDLQTAGMAADTELRKANNDIEKLKEQLKDLKPGSGDFKRIEEEITQRMSDLKVTASFKQRDFQERQMKAMYLIYREISEEVKRYSQANGIMLVMDYSSDPVDINVPATIQRQVTKPFVYQGGPDITQPILDALNQRALAAKPAGGAPGGTPGGTRQR